MALTALPEEVLELIVKQLTVKDLISCSTVNIEWREKFNNDIFWKIFCIKEIKDILEHTVCEVHNHFQIVPQNEGRLQPICLWRLHYMRKTHLINNWKGGKFFSTPIRMYEGVHSVELKMDKKGNHWLFIKTRFEIEIWNVNTIPEIATTMAIFPDCLNTSIMLSDGKVIVSQWNILTVYSLKPPFEMFFKCLLEDGEELDRRLRNSLVKSDLCGLNEEDDYRFDTFGSLIIGHKRIPNPPSDTSMHVWSLKSKEKVQIESMLKNDTGYIEIAFSNIFKIDDNTGIIRILSLSLENQLRSLMYIYDFNKLKFKDTNIENPGVVVWCGYAHNIIISFSSDPGTIKFYNFATSKLISTREIGIYTNSEQMQLIDSYLLYCMFNCMNVLDIHNQEVVYCLEFSFYSFVRRLTVIGSRFVVVWLLERGGSPGCPSYYQEVWDMKDLTNKLLQFSSELGYEMISDSPSLIKQVACYNSEVHLCTFW